VLYAVIWTATAVAESTWLTEANSVDGFWEPEGLQLTDKIAISAITMKM
jgi:hypothetical protein